MECEGLGGGGGGARVSGGRSRGCESESGDVLFGPRIEKCRGPVNASEQLSSLKDTETESLRSTQLPRLPKDNLSLELNYGRINNPPDMLVPGSEEKQAGKVPRNDNGYFKRPRMLQVETPRLQSEVACTHTAPDKLGPILMKCLNAEKNQTVRTKNNLNNKRGDRRNVKVPVKAKCDSGLASFNMASGGGNPLGNYGLKPEAHEVAQLMEDICLKDLLDGSYQCPPSGKEKGKKTANTSDNILHSVNKALSVLRIRRPGQTKQPESIGTGLNNKASLLSSASCSSVANSIQPEDNRAPDLSSCDTASCVQAEALADTLDIPSQPRDIDILGSLMLPAPKDLESLLQDASRAVAPSRCSDPCSTKATSRRFSLPPLPWSHNYNGHCKSNSDAAKLGCRSVCVGRWVRIENTSSFLGVGTKCLEDIDSLTYDVSLVPPGKLKYSIIERGSTSLPRVAGFQPASSSGKYQAASVSPSESGSNAVCKENAPGSPRLVAAAQTLWDIARSSLIQDPNGITKWPKQPSQKAMKARKSSEEPEGRPRPKPDTAVNGLSRIIGHPYPFKKPKLLMSESKEDYSDKNSIRGPNYWSAPRSSRSSPIRLHKDTVAEARHNQGNFTRQTIMIPPPPRFVEKTNHSQQKLRKVVPMDWSRTKR